MVENVGSVPEDESNPEMKVNRVYRNMDGKTNGSRDKVTSWVYRGSQKRYQSGGVLESGSSCDIVGVLQMRYYFLYFITEIIEV